MFYENLEKVLKQKNLTLNKLAKGCEIAQSQTTKWKKGYIPGSEIVIKICKYLDVSADYLLDLDETPPPLILTDQEKELLEHFRQCDPGTQKSVCMLASSGAAEQLSKETSFNSKNVG